MPSISVKTLFLGCSLLANIPEIWLLTQLKPSTTAQLDLIRLHNPDSSHQIQASDSVDEHDYSDIPLKSESDRLSRNDVRVLWNSSLNSLYLSEETYIISPWMVSALGLSRSETMAAAEILRNHVKKIIRFEQQILQESTKDERQAYVLPPYPEKQLEFNEQLKQDLSAVVEKRNASRMLAMFANNPMLNAGNASREIFYKENEVDKSFQPWVSAYLPIEGDKPALLEARHAEYMPTQGFFAERYSKLVDWQSLAPSESDETN